MTAEEKSQPGGEPREVSADGKPAAAGKPESPSVKPWLHGRKPGDRRVRVDRPHAEYFRYAGPGTLVARERASEPRTSSGRIVERVRHVLFGRRLSIHDEMEERLSK